MSTIYKLYGLNARPGPVFPSGSVIPSASCLDASDATAATLVYDQDPEVTDPRTVIVADYGNLAAFDPTLATGFVAYARWSFERPGHQFGINAGLCSVDISSYGVTVPAPEPNEIIEVSVDYVAFYGVGIAQTYASVMQSGLTALNHFFDTKFAPISGELDVARLHSSWIEVTVGDPPTINARQRPPVRIFS